MEFNSIVGILSQCMHISNHHIIHFISCEVSYADYSFVSTESTNKKADDCITLMEKRIKKDMNIPPVGSFKSSSKNMV